MVRRSPFSRAFLAAQIDELARDLTALGNPAILLLLVVLVRLDLVSLALIGLLGIEFACRTIKVILFTPRPTPARYVSLIEQSDAGSFPSIHTARCAFVCAALFSVTDRAVLSLVLITLPVVVGLTRLKLGKHRVIDVVAGLAIGTVSSLMLSYALPGMR